jgi:hypothetical protein
MERQAYHNFGVSLRSYIRLSQLHHISLISVAPYTWNKKYKRCVNCADEDGITMMIIFTVRNFNVLINNLHNFSIP